MNILCESFGVFQTYETKRSIAEKLTVVKEECFLFKFNVTDVNARQILLLLLLLLMSFMKDQAPNFSEPHFFTEYLIQKR